MKAPNTTLPILISGVTGYLGRKLARDFTQRGFKVLGLVRSPTKKCTDFEPIHLNAHWKSQLPQLCGTIHCATNYGGKDVSFSTLIQTNVQFACEIFEETQKAKAEFFLNIDTSLPPDASEYALTKSYFRTFLEKKGDSTEFATINVPLEHYYGPGAPDRNFVSFVTRSLVNLKPRLALSEGTQKRDFIFIEDCVNAIRHLVDRRTELKGYTSIPVGTGKATDIRTLVSTLCELTRNTKTELDWGAVPFRPGEPMNLFCDMTQAEHLGWQPTTGLEDGLRLTVEGEL